MTLSFLYSFTNYARSSTLMIFKVASTFAEELSEEWKINCSSVVVEVAHENAQRHRQLS
jgi:hypothetical protein